MMFMNSSKGSKPFGSAKADSKKAVADVVANEKGFEDLQFTSSGRTRKSLPDVQTDQEETESNREFLRATNLFANFLRQQRARYYPIGRSLGPKSKTFLARFFDPALLGQVKIVELTEERVANPDFFAVAKEMGYRNLPDLAHQSSVTFLDVIVFNETITERSLFHGLVHVTQVQMLGIERFAKLFVRGFQRSKSYFMIPLKAHAFTLDCQFAENRYRGFSVETEVVRWLEEERY
jgi:hypothetical protein